MWTVVIHHIYVCICMNVQSAGIFPDFDVSKSWREGGQVGRRVDYCVR